MSGCLQGKIPWCPSPALQSTHPQPKNTSRLLLYQLRDSHALRGPNWVIGTFLKHSVFTGSVRPGSHPQNSCSASERWILQWKCSAFQRENWMLGSENQCPLQTPSQKGLGQADGERKLPPPNMCHSFSYKNGILPMLGFFNLPRHAPHNLGALIKSSCVCRVFIFSDYGWMPGRQAWGYSQTSARASFTHSRALGPTVQSSSAQVRILSYHNSYFS